MKKSRKKSKQYFTKEVDYAIVEYNNSTDFQEKEKLYREVIFPAFDKLCENIINTFKFPYIELSYDDLKHEVVSFLTEKLYKFSASSGKAFSYYSIVCKNYLIAKNTKSYKLRKQIEDLEVVDVERDIINEIASESFQDSLSSYIDEWVGETEKKLAIMFIDDVDVVIADSILEVFKKRSNLEIYNKKAFYFSIRERVDVKTPKITRVIGILKQDFYDGLSIYLK